MARPTSFSLSLASCAGLHWTVYRHSGFEDIILTKEKQRSSLLRQKPTAGPDIIAEYVKLLRMLLKFLSSSFWPAAQLDYSACQLCPLCLELFPPAGAWERAMRRSCFIYCFNSGFRWISSSANHSFRNSGPSVCRQLVATSSII